MSSNARQLAANLPREGGLSNRNVIINGDFSISQRGDYASSPVIPSADGYYLDRWKDWGGVARTIQKLTASINGVTQNTLKYVCTTGATGTYMGARQLVEAVNLQDGQQYTISCMMRTNNANARIRTYDFNGLTGGVTSDACPSDGNWHKITLTQTHTSGANPQVGFIIYSGTETTVDIATNDYVEVANFQCEVGDTATPFEHRSYGQELALCQRYYQKSYTEAQYAGSISTGGAIYWRTTSSTSSHAYHIRLPVAMRAAPTCIPYNGITGASGTWRGSGGADYTAYPFSIGTSAFSVDLGTSTAGQYIQAAHWVADAEL